MTTLARTPYSPEPAVIVASPNYGLRKQIMQNFLHSKIPALEALGGADALGKLESSECQLLLLDRKLPDLEAEELMHIIHEQFPGIDVLLLDEAGQPPLPGQSAEWRSRDAHEVFAAIARWNSPAAPAPERLALEPTVNQLPGLVGASACMLRVAKMARLVAPRKTPVLITGPTGTGKELVARALHQLSPRADKPFVVLNCAAIPEALLEAELFGYARGAFTGAVQPHVGRIQSANGGTLFLDEIGELPLGMQAKLLRFLDQGEVQRLGSTETLRVDVRVIAATNARLDELSRQRLFREDLYYRLAVFPLELPRLSERGPDIETLARHFLERFDAGEEAVHLSPAAARILQQHSWPGNVRELQHVMERATILAEGGAILPQHLGLPLEDGTPAISPAAQAA